MAYHIEEPQPTEIPPYRLKIATTLIIGGVTTSGAIIEGFSDYVLARIYVSDRDDPTRYPGVPMPYPCFTHASRMLHACFTHALRMLYRCFTDASRLEYSG